MTSENIGSADVLITADFSSFDEEVRARLTAAAQRAGTAAEKILKRSGNRAGEQFSGDFEKSITRGASKAGSDSGNFFGRAFRTAAARSIGTGLFRALVASTGGLLAALGPLPGVLGGAVAATVALAAALATASGSALALGGVLGSLGLAAGALKVGFSGVGDAIKAQSAAQEELARTGEISTAAQEKLDAALKNLTPSAAALVRQLAAMAPAWRAVTQSVQERLFVGVGQSIAALGNRYLPILNSALTTTAGVLNGAARNFAAFLNTSTRATQLSSIFTGLNSVLKTLLTPLSTVAGGFLDIFRASLPFAQRLANVLSTLSTSFGAFLTQSAKSGDFARFMETAFAAAQQLFRLLGNLGSIIGQVFAAGTASGGNLLTILADITGQFSQFLRSAEGQSALASFFGLIATAGKTLVGIFSTLKPLLSGIGALFSALQGPVAVLGGALTRVIGLLAGTLGGALRQLGPVLGQLVTALAPLVTVLGGVLSGAIKAILPVVISLVSALASLVPSITPLVQLLGTALVTTLQQLSGLFVQIVPVLAQLIAGLAAGLQPVLVTLQPVLAQLVTALVGVAQALLPIVTSLIPLMPSFAQLTLVVAQLVVALTPLATSILGSVASLLTTLAPIIASLVPPLISFIGALVQTNAKIVSVIATVARFAAQVVSSFARARDGAITAVSALIARVASFFTSLVARVAGAMASFRSTVSSGISAVVGFFSGLIGRVSSAISGLASALFRAGSDAVQGLINGIKSRAGAVASAAQDLANKAASAIKGALKIGSPSKVTTAYGEDTGQGFVNGILSKVRAVGRAATTLAQAVPDQIEKSFKKLDLSLQNLGASLPTTVRRRINAVATAGRAGIAALERASTSLDSRLAASQTRLQDLLKASQQLAQSVSQAVLQTGNIAQSQNTSFAGIVSQLRNAVNNAKQFSTVLAGLRKSGLNAASLQQIAEAGPETGTAIGRSILNAGRSGVAEINKLQLQLQKAAAAAAKTASDAVFGQGLRLAQGVVTGLQRQKAALDRQMVRLADVLVARVLSLLRSLKLPGINTLNIPGFAGGGVVGREQIVRVAERNRREAIIPLTRPRRAREIMDQTGLSAMAAGQGSSRRTVEVPIHVAGNVVDYDALTTHIEKVLTKFGLRPVLGLNLAGGTV